MPYVELELQKSSLSIYYLLEQLEELTPMNIRFHNALYVGKHASHQES